MLFMIPALLDKCPAHDCYVATMGKHIGCFVVGGTCKLSLSPDVRQARLDLQVFKSGRIDKVIVSEVVSAKCSGLLSLRRAEVVRQGQCSRGCCEAV